MPILTKTCFVSRSCLNGGTCIDRENYYKCVCPNGYTGANCQTKIHPCDSNPCMNGATCSNKQSSWECVCPYGFTGPRCEVIYILEYRNINVY